MQRARPAFVAQPDDAIRTWTRAGPCQYASPTYSPAPDSPPFAYRTSSYSSPFAY